MAGKNQYDLSNFPYFQYKGRRSNEMGMRILKNMELVVLEPLFNVTDVDGLNRDVIMNRQKYADIDKNFPVRLFKDSEKHIAQSMREVVAWLYSEQEYSPVLFSAYDEYFYKGFPYGGAQALDENVNGLWVDFTIKFKMQPFIFRINGLDERPVRSGQVITDSEDGIAYNKDTMENVSSDVLITNESYSPFTLDPGRNEINYDGMTNVKITPNWRTLAV